MSGTAKEFLGTLGFGGEGRSLPPNKSLQRTWLSRLHLLPVFVCGRFGGCGARCFSRHAAELPPIGQTRSVCPIGAPIEQEVEDGPMEVL
jgi:hypothetical protein